MNIQFFYFYRRVIHICHICYDFKNFVDNPTDQKVNADLNCIRNKIAIEREAESGCAVNESCGPAIARAVAAGATYS